MPDTDQLDLTDPTLSGDAGKAPILTPKPGGDSTADLKKPPSEAELVQQNQQLQGDISKLYEQQSQEQSTVADQASTTLKQGAPAPPVLEQPQKFQPTQETTEGYHKFMAGAMLFATLAGAIGRNHIGSAVAALSGALQGYKEGNQQKLENERANFNTKMNEIRARNDAMLQEYDAATKKYGNDLDGLRAESEVIAAKYGTPIAAKQAQVGNNQGLLNYYALIRKTNVQLAQAQQKNDMTLQKMAETVRHNHAVEGINRTKAIAGTPAQQQNNAKIDEARQQLIDMMNDPSKQKETRALFARGTDSVINDKVVGPIFAQAMKQKTGGDEYWKQLKNWELNFTKKPGPPPAMTTGQPQAAPPRPVPKVTPAAQALLSKGGQRGKWRDASGATADSIRTKDGNVYDLQGNHIGHG